MSTRANAVKELEIQSPCRQVCQLTTRNICIGCGRSLDEIAEWSSAPASRKQQIVLAARTRLQEIKTNERHQDQ